MPRILRILFSFLAFFPQSFFLYFLFFFPSFILKLLLFFQSLLPFNFLLPSLELFFCLFFFLCLSLPFFPFLLFKPSCFSFKILLFIAWQQVSEEIPDFKLMS